MPWSLWASHGVVATFIWLRKNWFAKGKIYVDPCVWPSSYAKLWHFLIVENAVMTTSVLAPLHFDVAHVLKVDHRCLVHERKEMSLVKLWKLLELVVTNVWLSLLERMLPTCVSVLTYSMPCVSSKCLLAFCTIFLPHGSWFAWKGSHADPDSWHNLWANLWAHDVCRMMTLPLFGDWFVGPLIVMNNSHVLHVLLTPYFCVSLFYLIPPSTHLFVSFANLFV